MGIPVITADPAPESFAYLARLCQEYRIRVAIHNHGPNTRYDTIRTVEDAMRGQPDWIGACIDTAHFLRSGEDPVEAARRFGKRVHAVHLKDVKDRTRYTLLGEGDLDLVGFLRVLRRIRAVSDGRAELLDAQDGAGGDAAGDPRVGAGRD